MQNEKSCGGVVYRKYHGNTEILLIRHVGSSHWSFPKGHVESGETEIQTAEREIKEETGIDVVVDPTFRELVTYSPKKDIQKDVIYFIARAISRNPEPQEKEIAEARWVEINLAPELLAFDNDRSIVAKAKRFIP